MLHMVRISRGGATFCSRYVGTHKHAVEREAGCPVVPNFFAAFNGVAAAASRCLLTAARVATGQFDPVKCGFGTANTSLALIAGQLYALCESDLPYAIKITPDGDIITLGRHDFHSRRPFSRMTAHPKIDRATAEAFAFRYNIVSPFLTLFKISSDGKKQKDVPIHSIRQLTAMHDFALTENYCIIPDVQIVVNPLWILRGRSPIGADDGKVPRLGIIPKHAEDERELQWIDVPGFNALHCVNAWEENGGEIVNMVASNAVSVEHVFERFDRARLTLEMVTVDVERKTAERRRLSEQCLEFGVINPAYAAKKNRYIYASVIGTTALTGVVKLDLLLADDDKARDCTVASRNYGPGCYGSEAVYVARDPDNPTADEDDGYLVTYMHDKNNQESKCLIMDAKSPTLDVVAAVKLPQRVPDGFHGLFVPEKYLEESGRMSEFK